MKNGKYILIKAPDDFPGMKYRGRYCYEHVYVYWKKYGVLPEQNKTLIHHINHDKHDNRVENLQLITVTEHRSIYHCHGETEVELVCNYCGSKFNRKVRRVNHNKATGQINFYCNKQCLYNKQRNQ